MKQIKLGKSGLVALVDDEDFEFLSQWKWHLSGHGSDHGYAISTLAGTGRMFMHIIVNNTPKNFDTDHINRNKLDNRKENLRTVNKMINGRNRGENKNNTSGHKGISWDKQAKKWEIYIWKQYKKIHLGYSDNIKKAYEIRLAGERKHWV